MFQAEGTEVYNEVMPMTRMLEEQQGGQRDWSTVFYLLVEGKVVNEVAIIQGKPDHGGPFVGWSQDSEVLWKATGGFKHGKICSVFKISPVTRGRINCRGMKSRKREKIGPYCKSP
jgi:hypothetical protein